MISTQINGDKTIIKEKLEIFGRKLTPTCGFRNGESCVISNPFKVESEFNPQGKHAAIKLYLTKLKQEIPRVYTKLSHSFLLKGKRLVFKAL